MIEFTYNPDWRWLAGGLGLGGALLGLSYFFGKGRAPWGWRLMMIFLRIAVAALVILCLLDPQKVEEDRHQTRSRLAVLLDTSRSMSVSDVASGRLQQARSWIKETLLPAVPSGVSVSYYTFDGGLRSCGNVDSVSATGAVTALTEALENVLGAPGDDPLLGVLLCSDGNETAGRDPETAARVYYRKGIPLHTLIVGTTNDLHDIILENVQVRRIVPNEAPTRLALTLRAPGFENKSVPVQIRSRDRTMAVQEVRLTGGAQRVEMDFTPTEKGFQVFEVTVPPQPGEWLVSNNRRAFGLEVVDPTIRVLYLEGTPQQPGYEVPEWKYLKDALESDKQIKVKVLVRTTGTHGQRLHPGKMDPDTGERVFAVENATHGFPRTMDELLKYDVVIHSDIRKESFTPEQLQNIARLVEEHGGGFVMIGGASAFGKGGYHKTILDRIILVAMEQSDDSQARAIQMQVPAGAWQHPLIALGATREQTEAIWTTRFPHLYGCNLVDHAKPGAVVLGQDPARRNGYGPLLLMAVQEIGKGRSMAFTSDTTRAWGRDFETLWGEPINPALPLSEANCDSRYYRQFWVNAVRWLAAGRLGKTNNSVLMELARNYAAPGEKIGVAVKLANITEDTAGLDVSVALASGRSNLVTKASYDPAQRAYVAAVRPPSAGDYTVAAAVSRAGRSLGEDKQLLVCEEGDREMADVRSKPALMARLARVAGGQSFTVADKSAAAIAAAFANAPEPVVEYRRQPIWDRAWTLSTLLGLLGIEWALRRWRGLA